MPTYSRFVDGQLVVHTFPCRYGEFSREDGGRLAGTVLLINPMRKDGKIPVTYAFGSGKRINKLLSVDQLISAVEKFETK